MLAAQEQVAGDVQRRRDGQRLVDGLDARRAGLLRAAERDRSPSTSISPASGIIAPDRHLISVDLPGAVVADHREHLARIQFEVDAGQADDTAEGLDQAARLEDGRRLGRGVRHASRSGSTGRRRPRR